MKVLLIRPPYTRLRGVGQSPYFPLGLGYIASVLKDNSFEVSIYHAENPRFKQEHMLIDPDIVFDFRSAGYHQYLKTIKDNNHYVWKEVEETLKSYKPDIIGISLLSVEVAPALKISQICKQYNDKAYVVWGGVHPTFLPDDCLKNKEVDFVIRGEGEYSMLELCEALRKGVSISGVKGLSFKNNGEIIHNPNREAIANLDEIPLPARDNVLYPESFDFRSLGSMIVSRGCPFRCTFCSSRNFWGREVRLRSPENVINEINTVKKLYGTSYFMFWDDSFTINRRIIETYCNAIINSKLKITWRTATRADLVDEQILRLMRKAGCVKLEIGVESGSDRMKKIIYKDVTNNQIQKAFEMITKNGISSGAFFMAGFPEETLEDIHQTFQFMKELNAGEIFLNILDPMPGSTEYEKCIKFGLVPENPDWNNFPFWPDAHYVRDISRENFAECVNMMARWLFSKNKSIKNRFRRNKYLVLSLLKNDPISLLTRTYRFIKRRRQCSDTSNFNDT
jgi:radical SAM superfamily enzyme YgiQ (UPF0313 family)